MPSHPNFERLAIGHDVHGNVRVLVGGRHITSIPSTAARLLAEALGEDSPLFAGMLKHSAKLAVAAKARGAL